MFDTEEIKVQTLIDMFKSSSAFGIKSRITRVLSSPVSHSSYSWSSCTLLSLLFCVSKWCLLCVCSRPLPHVFCRETTGRLQKGKAVTSPPNVLLICYFGATEVEDMTPGCCHTASCWQFNRLAGVCAEVHINYVFLR